MYGAASRSVAYATTALPPYRLTAYRSPLPSSSPMERTFSTSRSRSARCVRWLVMAQRIAKRPRRTVEEGTATPRSWSRRSSSRLSGLSRSSSQPGTVYLKQTTLRGTGASSSSSGADSMSEARYLACSTFCRASRPNFSTPCSATTSVASGFETPATVRDPVGKNRPDRGGPP